MDNQLANTTINSCKIGTFSSWPLNFFPFSEWFNYSGCAQIIELLQSLGTCIEQRATVNFKINSAQLLIGFVVISISESWNEKTDATNEEINPPLPSWKKIDWEVWINNPQYSLVTLRILLGCGRHWSVAASFFQSGKPTQIIVSLLLQILQHK